MPCIHYLGLFAKEILERTKLSESPIKLARHEKEEETKHKRRGGKKAGKRMLLIW